MGVTTTTSIAEVPAALRCRRGHNVYDGVLVDFDYGLGGGICSWHDRSARAMSDTVLEDMFGDPIDFSPPHPEEEPTILAIDVFGPALGERYRPDGGLPKPRPGNALQSLRSNPRKLPDAVEAPLVEDEIPARPPGPLMARDTIRADYERSLESAERDAGKPIAARNRPRAPSG